MALSRLSFRQEDLSRLCVHGASCGQALGRRRLPGFSTETSFPPVVTISEEFTHKPEYSLLSLSLSLSAYQNFLLTPENSFQLFHLRLRDTAVWECGSPISASSLFLLITFTFWEAVRVAFILSQ